MKSAKTFEIFASVSAPRTVTPGPRPGPLVLGHFVRTRDYAGWRPNGARDWHLLYTVAGRGRVGTPGGERLLEPGRVVLFTPGTPEDYGLWLAPGRKTGHWELLWAHFLPPAGWSELLRWPEWSPGLHTLQIEDPRHRRQVEGALKRGCVLWAQRLQRRQDFGWNALHEALLWCDVHNPRSDESRVDTRIRRVIDYVTEDLRRPFSIDGLAQVAGLSPSQLIGLFNRQLGQTPRKFWESRRLEHARHLIERTQLSMAEIADAAGYDDPFYFSTRFKREVGFSPRRYRQQVESGLPPSPPAATPPR